MKDLNERLQSFKNNPANFPFKKKEEKKEIGEEKQLKKKRVLPIRFKKAKELSRDYESVKRKNILDVNGLSKSANNEALNILTAPSQIIINSILTSLFSVKKDESFKLTSLLENLFSKKIKNELDPSLQPKAEPSNSNVNVNKDLSPYKSNWSNVDWEWINKKYPKFTNSLHSFNNTAKSEAVKLLSDGKQLEHINPSSNDSSIRKSFDLIQDKSKELFHSAFKDYAKNIKVDFSEINDAKDFIVRLNQGTGRKMSALDMVVNIILIKEARGENTDKEIEGLFNHLRKQNKIIDLEKVLEKLENSVRTGLKTGLVVTGESLKISGKVMEATGKSLEAVGKAVESIPVVGTTLGGALATSGKGLEEAGKDMSQFGKSIDKKHDSKFRKLGAPTKIIGIKDILSKASTLSEELDRTPPRTNDNELTI